MLTLVGIDPGVSGAVAVLTGNRIDVHDIPTLTVKKGAKVRTRVDKIATLSLFARLARFGADLVLIEDVNGAGGQSAPAAFQFGYATCVLAMASLVHGFETREVAPVAWKTKINVLHDTDGDKARAKAAALFPDQAHLFARKKDHNRADAALIAYYAREYLCN